VQRFLNDMPARIDEYENLLTSNPIWLGRIKGVGYLSAAEAIALGVTGPPARASGVDWDLRRDMPYSGYEKFKFNVPVMTDGDVWARYVVRVQEMRESVKICQQALDMLKAMPATAPIVSNAPKIVLPNREQMKTLTEGFAVPAGEVFQAVESPRGEMGYYVVSDGTAKPYRVHMRNPSFATLQALETMCKGRMLADVVAVIGSIDIVLGEIDR
jgi:NADH-quinone oxidoreductase subunit D